MHRRKALAAALAVGVAAAPAATAILSLGVLASPAVAEGGHHHRGHHAWQNANPANSYTITLRGIISGTPTATELQIIPVGRGHLPNCQSTPKLETIILDTNTTFSTPSNPTASVADLSGGDKVTVTITARPRS